MSASGSRADVDGQRLVEPQRARGHEAQHDPGDHDHHHAHDLERPQRRLDRRPPRVIDRWVAPGTLERRLWGRADTGRGIFGPARARRYTDRPSGPARRHCPTRSPSPAVSSPPVRRSLAPDVHRRRHHRERRAGREPQVVIIGAGPAGLTAAYELAKRGVTCTVLEADDVVGGISRTVERDGWRFDIGGHRFFTKVPEVEAFWHEILEPDEFLLRPRMSRIYYEGKFYDYPIKPMNALRNLGLIEAVRCVVSYLWVRVRPPKDQSTLEGYVVANYGWRLYHHFFKTYNEKVWGVPASEHLGRLGRAAHQGHVAVERGVGAAPGPARRRAATGRSRSPASSRSSSTPSTGPGMMWERCQRAGRGAGHQGRHRHRRSPGSATTTAGSRSVVAETRRRRDRVPVPPRHLLDAVPAPAPGHGPAGARRRAPGRRRPRASATSSPSPSSCPPTRSPGPTTGSTSTPPTSRRCASRTSARGRRTWSRTGHNVPRPRVLRDRGRRVVDRLRRRPRREGQGRARDARPGRRRRRRGRLRRADAQGLPGLRRALPGQRRRAAGLARPSTPRTCTRSAATACTGTTTRTTRCSRPC